MIILAIMMCEHGRNLLIRKQNSSAEFHALSEEELIKILKQYIHDLETEYSVSEARSEGCTEARS